MTGGTAAQCPPQELAFFHQNVYTTPFWNAAREHRLVAAQCVQCAAFMMPPRPRCRRCGATQVRWVELTGEGRLYTFTIVRQAAVPALKTTVPYVLAVVDLVGAAECRLVSNILNVDVEDVSIGMELEVVWSDATPSGEVLPRFQPVGAG